MSQPQYRRAEIAVEQGVLVLTIAETEFYGEELAECLREDLCAAVAATDAKKIVVDFQRVTYISSMGLQALLSFRKFLRGREGQMLLCSLSDNVAEVFFTTKLISATTSSIIPFAVAPDRATAVRHLSGAASAKPPG